ncbi:MAG: sigma-70 family RNA polymerase sigma factor [Gemmataceae bacterium]
MTTTTPTRLARQLRRVLDAADPATDAELLDRFRGGKDPAALDVLIRRHGSLVLAACRKVLTDDADIDDAFQATFLLLLKNARAIRDGRAVGGWLYGVAHRVAVRAKQNADRRRFVETRRPTRAAAPAADLSWREAVGILHEELDRLPDGLRLPLLLCYFEGCSRDEAAAQLGCSVGSVKSRLERGRNRLHARLLKRGVALSAGLLAFGGATTVARGLSPALIQATVRAATERCPKAVAALVAGTSRTVFPASPKFVIATLVAAGLLAGVAGFRAEPPAQANPADPPKPAAPKADAPPPETKTYVGRVVGPDGKPAAGARLFIPKSATERVDVVEIAISDDAGRFRFEAARPASVPPTRWVIAARAPGFAGDWAELRDGQSEISLKLVADVPVEGRLLDLEGRARPGLTVELSKLETTPGGDLSDVFKLWAVDPALALKPATKMLYPVELLGLPRTITADRQGRFTLNGVGHGRIAVLKLSGDEVAHATLRTVCVREFDPKALAPKAGQGMMPFRGAAPLIFGPKFDFSVVPPRLVEGTVRDQATGQPVAGAWVNGGVAGGWWEDSIRVETDTQGRFRLAGLPKAPKIRLNIGTEDAPYLPSRQEVGDVEGLGPLTVDVQLARGVAVSARLLGPDGKPIQGHVTYVPLAANKFFGKTPGADIGRYQGQSSTTDPAGTVRLTALPGPGVLLARASDGHRYTQARITAADKIHAYRQNLRPDAGDTFSGAGNSLIPLMGVNAYRVIDPAADAGSLTVELRCSTGKKLAGDVLGPDGQPLAGATASGLVALGQGPVNLSGTTFEATGLDPEAPRPLTFRHKVKKLAGTLTLRGDEAKRPAVTLQPTGSITARLLGEDRQPLAGVEARIFYEEQSANSFEDLMHLTEAVHTDAQGRVRIDGVVPGLKCMIVFRKGGRYFESGKPLERVTLTAGATMDLGDLTAKKPGE